MTEHIAFDTDELAYSSIEDHARGKVYRAGRALGVPAGNVLVIDMETGEEELVEADRSGTRPKAEGGGASPFVRL